MNDEVVNNEPSKEIVPVETTVPFSQEPVVTEQEKTKEGHHSLKLENIPDNIRKDLHELIAKGYKGHRCKRILEDRWLGKTAFLPAVKETYDAYIEKHGPDILKQLEVQKSLIEATKESLEDTKNAIDSVEDDELDLTDKKKIFQSLFAKCATRIKLIESYNCLSGFINPQFESVLSGYLKEQRSILETLVKLQTELNKDSESQTYQEVEDLFYMCLVQVVSVYKELHGEGKLMEYQGKIQEAVSKTLIAYKQNKENPEK